MFSWLLVIALSLLGHTASAQAPDAREQKTAATEKPATDHLDRLTPYGCVRGFLIAASRGDYARAAEYLDVLSTPSREQELARKLESLLNSERSGRLDQLARNPEGKLDDGLPTDHDRVGHVNTASGTFEIVLRRVHRPDAPPIWLFSSQTLKGVPAAFQEIGTPRIARFLPTPLLTIRFLTVPLWRWLAIILILIVALGLASLVSRALAPLLGRVLRRMGVGKDDHRLLRLKGAVRLLFLSLAIRFLGDLSSDSLLGRELLARVAAIVAIAGITWLAIQSSDIMSILASRRLLQRGETGKLAIVGLARRLAKILIIMMAAITLLHGAGVNVTAMLAGLGVGGIALALAAQKTLENFFGGISVIMREAIRVGDVCKIADQTGTIEDIGLGSTSLRTLDRTVISVPNAQIAQMNLENISMRDKFWFHHVFGLRRDTTPEQMRSVLKGITEMLHGHPKVERETARIKFIAFGSSSLDIEIFAYVKERDNDSFLRIQQDLLLGIIDIVSASGTTISLPSQTTYLVGPSDGAIAGEERMEGKPDGSPPAPQNDGARDPKHPGVRQLPS